VAGTAPVIVIMIHFSRRFASGYSDDSLSTNPN
jgi:hypothetical protein